MLNLYRYHAQPQQLMGYADASAKIPSIAWDMAKTSMQKRKLEHLWAKDPYYAYRYAQDVIGKRWPPGEAAIAKDPKWAYGYAHFVMNKKPWPPGEKAIAGDAESAYRYARYVIKKPWPPGEAAIASRAKWAYYYALDVMGKWPPGESAIAGSAEWAYLYARDIIEKRWPPGEAAIAKDPSWAYLYARDIIEKRWPPGEAAIAKDPKWAYLYAEDIIGKRWPPGEAAIASDPEYAARYAQDVIKKPQEQDVAEGLSQNQGQVRQTLNAWMNQDQQYEDPTQRVSFQAKVWPYIQKNIQSILSDKGADGKGSYPAAPYAAWLLVQHMDAYPQNQGKFLQQLEQSGLDPADSPGESGKLQFLRDRYRVNQWIAANANKPEYFINGEPLPNPTVNVRNPAMFKDAGQVATSRDGALKNAIAAGNKLLVDAIRATHAQTQPSFKQTTNENFADGRGPGRLGDSQPHGKYLGA